MSSERIVSAGVFTNERDLTFLPQGIGNIGAAIIGPTVKGRAFIPTTVESNTQFTTQYGGKTDESYVPFCVESYLQSAGTITVIRLLGLGGYTEHTIPLIINTGVNNYLGALLHPTRTVDADSDFKDTFLTSASFSSSYNIYSYSGSEIDTLNVTIDKGGIITLYDFHGNIAGTLGDAITSDTIITASGADLFVSASLSGTTIGSVLGLLNGSPLTSSNYTFTGSDFEGHVAGAVQLYFNSNSTSSGSVTSAIIDGSCALLEGTISGSISGSTGTTTAAFTSSIIPQSSGASFVNGGNVLFATDFWFKLSEDWYPVSLLPSSVNYIGKLFGYNPNTTLYNNLADDKDRAYNYVLFKNNLTTLLTNYPDAQLTTASIDMNFDGVQYSTAETPWITSQIISGKARNLFKIKTIADGNYANSEIKVGILNVKRSGEIGGTDYGSFDIVVRLVADGDETDKQQQVVENFSNLSLDKNAANYVCRVIGDKYPEFSVDSFGMSRITMKGDYDNKSNYIRIEVDDNVKFRAYDPALVPFGFKAYRTPVDATGLLGASALVPAVNYITDQTVNSEYNSRVYFGFDFNFNTCDNEYYLNPLPSGSTTGSNADFNLDNMFGNANSGYSGSLSGSAALLNQRKFIVGFQGGFDGWSPSLPKLMGEDISATNVMGFDCSTSNTDGTKAYRYALSLISNQDEYDLNLLLTPGITQQLHPAVISKGIELCEDRSDVFYIFDLARLTETNINTLTDLVLGIDTNYAATYHPWVKILNSDNNQTMWVPPSVLMAGVIAYNDKVSYEWYAPAGLNRGGLTEALDVYTKLYQSDRDSLYENRINPIASFPRYGIAAWGQKTLQVKPSALDRISVRRLLITVKKYIASASKYLLFEQNTSATRNKFLNIVNPYLESIQQRQGLYSFKVVMDETNNTPDIIDRNILYGQIYLQPTRTAEFILLDFNIQPTGATFPQ